MLDIWSWICELPCSEGSVEKDSPLVFGLASAEPGHEKSAGSAIELRAERTCHSLTFAVCLHGDDGKMTTLWVSDTCPISSDRPFLPLVLQLCREIIERSPGGRGSTCPRSQLKMLRPDPVLWVMDSHSPESFSSFFNLLLLMRLFWLCACDAPSEVGALYFRSLLGPSLEAPLWEHSPALRTFLVSVGVDAELCLMRTLGYMLAKWLLSREMRVGLQAIAPSPNAGFSYATEVHGLWVLKGYVPVSAMNVARPSTPLDARFPLAGAKEAVLKYALAHQQLEVVVQLEYSTAFHEGYVQVKARMDNMRLRVAKLGFHREDDDVDDGNSETSYFPSRVRVWVGPEVGAGYVGGLSLGRSTKNEEREIETQRVVKGSMGKWKPPRVKAMTRTATRARKRDWRWEQDAQGNAAVFEAKASRPFTRTGRVVFAGDEYGENVGWRLNKEMEGSVLKWRIGGKVWLSRSPDEGNKNSYSDTRFVEWCHEVDLPLIPTH